MVEDKNGWNEYSKLVLKELASLSNSIEFLKTELHNVKQELAKAREREEKVDQLRAWKDKIDDIITPNQLEKLLEQVEDLKTFKTRSTTIFAVVQVVWMAATFFLNYFK